MSKEQKPPALTPKEADEAINKIATGQDSPATLEEAWNIVDKAGVDGMKDLSREYFKFSEHGLYMFMVTGMSITDFNGKEVPVVEFQTREGKQYINGDTVFVGACEKLTTVPCFVKVDYVGDIKNKQGSYKNLKVYTFPGNVQK